MGVIYVYHSVCRGQRTTLWESFFSSHLVETGCFCYYEAFIKLASPLVLSSSVVSASHLSVGVLGLHMHQLHLVFYVGAGNRTQIGCAFTPGAISAAP